MHNKCACHFNVRLLIAGNWVGWIGWPAGKGQPAQLSFGVSFSLVCLPRLHYGALTFVSHQAFGLIPNSLGCFLLAESPSLPYRELIRSSYKPSGFILTAQRSLWSEGLSSIRKSNLRWAELTKCSDSEGIFTFGLPPDYVTCWAELSLLRNTEGIPQSASPPARPAGIVLGGTWDCYSDFHTYAGLPRFSQSFGLRKHLISRTCPYFFYIFIRGWVDI